MRVTVRRTRRAYVYPARHFASPHTDPTLPRMGERLRLRADFDTSGFPPHARAILEGLKRYGMFVADNGQRLAAVDRARPPLRGARDAVAREGIGLRGHRADRRSRGTAREISLSASVAGRRVRRDASAGCTSRPFHRRAAASRPRSPSPDSGSRYPGARARARQSSYSCRRGSATRADRATRRRADRADIRDCFVGLPNDSSAAVATLACTDAYIRPLSLGDPMRWGTTGYR